MKVNESGYGNALVIYGGGLCALATDGVSCAAKYLSKTQMFNHVYVGFFSFLSLTNEALIKEWKAEYDGKIKHGGGYFGTCRNIDLTEKVKAELAFDVCKKKQIKWVFVLGGDGSSRQTSEIADNFNKEGINFVFLMPFTIDGINGGVSLGIKPAVKVSMWIIQQTAHTFLRTLESNQFGGAIFELQGRNRDDILLQVLKKLQTQKKIGDYPRKQVKILAIPANIPLVVSNLEKQIAMSSVTPEKPAMYGVRGVPTIVLLSEGSHVKKEAIVKIAANYGMKYRTFNIGHLSQMNDCITSKDVNQLDKMMKKSIDLCCQNFSIGKPFAVVFEEETTAPRIERISYFAELNPREAEQQVFTFEDEELLRKYMP